MSISKRLLDLARSEATPLTGERYGTPDPAYSETPRVGDLDPEPPEPAVDPSLVRWYVRLDLSPGADLAAVKTAYRSQVLRFHPDRFADEPDKQRDAETVVRALTEAYDALCAALDPD